MADDKPLVGFQTVQDANDDLNGMSFLFRQLLARVWTSALVQVVAVTNEGGVEPVGFVDVTPMVFQIDGVGTTTPHGIIHQVPYFRLQGGANAVILDPAVGDIGLAIFAHRDFSKVKNQDAGSRKPSPPDSFRRFDPADGLYVGGFLNAVPTQYVRFSADGVELVSPTQIRLQAPDIQFVGPTHTTGDVTGDGKADYTGDVTGEGISLHDHTHNVEHVQAGSSTIVSDKPN